MDLTEPERINNRIKRKEERCQWLRGMAEGVTGSGVGSTERVQMSTDPDRTSRIISTLAEEEKELASLQAEYAAAVIEVTRGIERVESALARRVLKLRYIDELTLAEIAELTEHSYAHTRRVHKEAAAAYYAMEENRR